LRELLEEQRAALRTGEHRLDAVRVVGQQGLGELPQPLPPAGMVLDQLGPWR